jgi:chaperone modulatory protein CbpM
MTQNDILTGELLDEVTLTLEELAQACAVDPEWIVARVEAGILGGTLQQPVAWCFASADLVRARRLVSIERDFDANQELAALVADLIEEVGHLKMRLKAAGLEVD